MLAALSTTDLQLKNKHQVKAAILNTARCSNQMGLEVNCATLVKALKVTLHLTNVKVSPISTTWFLECQAWATRQSCHRIVPEVMSLSVATSPCVRSTTVLRHETCTGSRRRIKIQIVHPMARDLHTDTLMLQVTSNSTRDNSLKTYAMSKRTCTHKPMPIQTPSISEDNQTT